MRVKKSLLIPILAILSGILLQLKSLGIFGDFIPDNFLFKLWPLLLIAAAMDLLFVERRIIGSVIMLFFAAALLSTQFMDAGWNNDIWQMFLKFWPMLLILFGIDSLFAGRSLINAAVIIMALVLVIYVVMNILDVPILDKLPFDLRSIIPTVSFENPLPEPNQNVPGPFMQDPVQQQTDPVINISANGQVSIPMPMQRSAQLNLNAASGKISLKGAADSRQLLSGSIHLDSKENLQQSTSVNNQTVLYQIRSQGASSAADSSNWDLSLSNQCLTSVNIALEKGYVKADMRGLNLNSVNIENKIGPVDVMLPQAAAARINITVSDGNLRIYIPKNTSISCTVYGTEQVEYPQKTYSLRDGVLTPRSTSAQVHVEVYSNNGIVKVIESE